MDARFDSMNERTSKLPIIAVIAVTTATLVTLSITQFRAQQADQQRAYDAARTEHQATESVMAKIGQDSLNSAQKEAARRDAIYRTSPDYIELKRLQDDDQRWLREHPDTGTDKR